MDDFIKIAGLKTIFYDSSTILVTKTFYIICSVKYNTLKTKLC